MENQVSSWITHASREPVDAITNGLDAWWRAAIDQTDNCCHWNTDPLRALSLAHIDRAAHKRRHHATFVSISDCERAADAHGDSPMATIVGDDPYGPQPLRISHPRSGSSLAAAIGEVKGRPGALAAVVITEDEFNDADLFDFHRSAQLDPRADGVIIPVLHVNDDAQPSAEDNVDRDDLLRAAGYSSYSTTLDDPHAVATMHRTLAVLFEDVFDDVASIKADVEARVLSRSPLWPIVVVHTSPAWRSAFGQSSDSLSSLLEPAC